MSLGDSNGGDCVLRIHVYTDANGCDANFDSRQIVANYMMHDVNASLWIGQLELEEAHKVKRRSKIRYYSEASLF